MLIWANPTTPCRPFKQRPNRQQKGNDTHWRSHFGSNIVEEINPPRVVAKSEEMNASFPLQIIGWQTQKQIKLNKHRKCFIQST